MTPEPTPPALTAIRCRAVGKRFGETAVLDGFDLSVPSGTILGLLGPSGSGKTTVLRVIAGFERPDAGSVEIAGRIVTDAHTMIPPEKRRVGMVFQDYALFPHLSVAANVGYGIPGPGRDTGVATALDLVDLGEAADRYPHELSGGEQQRVALARALAPEPAVVLLDEPFSNVDAPRRAQMRRDVRSILIEAKATAVFVTHDQEEAMATSDVVAVMRNGRVAQVDEPSELYRHPGDCWVARFLGDAEFVEGTARSGGAATPLVVFPVSPGLHGPVEVMVRPESVEVVPGGSDAIVVGTEFYGHDQLVTLQMPGGRRLLARTGPHPAVRPGDEVGIRVREVVAFEVPAGHNH